LGCAPKNEGKRVHVPPDEKTCGHTGGNGKPEIVVPGIQFRYFIFEIFGKMTNYAVFIPSLLTISTKS
jgi:hypothetical protein